MSYLFDKIRINTHYTRSINLERDSNSLSVVGTYIPTSLSIQTLERMIEAFEAEESPRSWSLVGPYGSGKSAFAVFLAHLLENPELEGAKSSYAILRNSNNTLSKRYKALIKESSGFFTILLTGSPEPLGKLLVQKLLEKSSELWSGLSGKKPRILHKLAEMAEKDDSPPVSQILECISELQTKLNEIGIIGFLIVIDELGKFLEYEARHHQVNEIFLLQSLAEHAMKANSTKLSLVVMLHQSFEHYSRGLGESLKNEWAKIQGRFENIPFLESSEQVLRVIAAAISHNFSEKESSEVQMSSMQIVKSLAKAHALSGTMDNEIATELFKSCYPLHPVSLILLPTLCQKVAQNERTLFSYLGSREKHGFQDSLTRVFNVGDWVYPWEIFDYFILNQPTALTDHFTNRRWAEVVTAIDRLGDAPIEEQQILKAIGLLNIIGTQGNFKASKEIVKLCFPDKRKVELALEKLQKKSIVQYRKFSAEYRVWQGSDFDLDERVEDELVKLGRFKLAEKINIRHDLLPIVARRYTIENGTLRYFMPTFADSATLPQILEEKNFPRIIFFLSENEEEEFYFRKLFSSELSDLYIFVIYKDGDLLRKALGETLALEMVEKNSQELNEDAVAQREFKERYAIARSKEETLLSVLIDHPESGEWYWKSKEPLKINGKKDFQEQLSKILNGVYRDCPVVKNELINRQAPSSQAVAATNKLASAMVNNESEENLGFEKYPPEKSIYLSLLKNSKLHKYDKGKWQFKKPQKDDDPCHFSKVWEHIDSFLDTTEEKANSLVELNKELIAPPFGIKEGVLPILYFAVILTYKHELAIFENRNYIPIFNNEQVSRFLKRPDEFTVQRFRIEGLNESIFEAYSHALFGNSTQKSLLSIARPIAQLIGNLPQYTLNTTKGLDDREKKLIDTFKKVKSPEEFLLKGIPRALGLSLESTNKEEYLKELSLRLKDSIQKLQKCHRSLIDEMRGLFAQSLSLPKDEELEQIRQRALGLHNHLKDYTVDREGLRAFLIRLQDKEKTDEEWLEKILMFLGQKPTKKWDDIDKDLAEFRLSEFTRKLIDLDSLRISYSKQKGRLQEGDFDVYLLRIIKKGAPDNEKTVVIDSKMRNLIKNKKDKIWNEIKSLKELNVQEALVAEIADELLHKNKKQEENHSETKIKQTIA